MVLNLGREVSSRSRADLQPSGVEISASTVSIAWDRVEA